MFDPDERKKKMERMKKEATDKVKLPPLTGYHATPGQSVDASQVVSRDDLWLYYFTQSEEIRNRHGVRTVNGKWEIVDWKLFDKHVDKLKRAQLRTIWNKGKT